MTGMRMPQDEWYGAAAGYLGMWTAMMVPMMLPSLVPMLARYRRSVRGVKGIHLHGLTVLVAAGYFMIWAAWGGAAYAAGTGILAAETRWVTVAQWLPVMSGVLLLVAGGAQLTSWKARRLALCRDGSGCGCPPAPHPLGAWRQGLRLGLQCSLCCGSLMLALLATGMMDLVAMAAVTLAIAAERLAPAPLRLARFSGAGIVLAAVVTIGRAWYV